MFGASTSRASDDGPAPPGGNPALPPGGGCCETGTHRAARGLAMRKAGIALHWAAALLCLWGAARPGPTALREVSP